MSLPSDLYIPPDALRVFLEAFEGPLDLLLYLIKKQDIDILNIPIAKITQQYLEYIEMMQDLQLELAADYMLMAVMLAEIKSRMLLPKPVTNEQDEEDPRAELVRRLQEYERYKQAAQDLDALPRLERDVFVTTGLKSEYQHQKSLPNINLQDLCYAVQEALQRAQMYESHHVQRETLSQRERMTQILDRLQTNSNLTFVDLFTVTEGRAGVIVTFSAILELLRQAIIDMVQAEPFGPIHIIKKG